MIISHDKLTEALDALGYEDVLGGVCFGYSAMKARAVALGETHKFEDRIHKMNQYPSGQAIAQAINDTKALQINTQALIKKIQNTDLAELEWSQDDIQLVKTLLPWMK